MRQTRFRAALALTAMTLAAACGDARLSKLSLGISEDSAKTAMGEPAHRTVDLLSGGKVWSVQFYTITAAGSGDSVPWRKMSPVVFIDHKAVGWGWGWWGDAATKQGIAMPK